MLQEGLKCKQLEEKKTSFTSSSSWARYDLEIVRFCFSVAAKSRSD